MLTQRDEKRNNLFASEVMPIWQRSDTKKHRMEVQSRAALLA